MRHYGLQVPYEYPIFRKICLIFWWTWTCRQFFSRGILQKITSSGFLMTTKIWILQNTEVLGRLISKEKKRPNLRVESLWSLRHLKDWLKKNWPWDGGNKNIGKIYNGLFCSHTVDGRIPRSPVEVGILSHCLQGLGYIQTVVVNGISEPSTVSFRSCPNCNPGEWRLIKVPLWKLYQNVWWLFSNCYRIWGSSQL